MNPFKSAVGQLVRNQYPKQGYIYFSELPIQTSRNSPQSIRLFYC